MFDKSIAKSGLQGKDCIPRLNRDLRFAKDKSPYKTYFYSIISKGGRKSGNAGYFIVIDPGDCRIGGGQYQPDAIRLNKVRQGIDYNLDEWLSIVKDSKLIKMFPAGVIAQEALKNIPNGFEPDNPAAEFLKMKGYYVSKNCSDIFLRKEQNFKTIIESFKACKELNEFVNRV